MNKKKLSLKEQYEEALAKPLRYDLAERLEDLENLIRLSKEIKLISTGG